MIKEFKEFALKGSLLDMAIGIMIGAAFGKIVTSFVADIVMPPIGRLLGGMDFTNLFVVLGQGRFATLEEAQAAGVPTLNYGLFINNILDFLIVAFVLFLVVRQFNRLRRKEEPKTKDCPYCFSAVSVKATRCPECTSQLEQAKA